ncbi:MAG: response regulator, partial [Burkholderiaceae bacterium]|nr:response regulator [Burkholderiaceae bacterium]
MNATQASSHGILLVETSSLTGSIIVNTARQLNLPKVYLTNSVRSAMQRLNSQNFSAVILSLEEDNEALQLLEMVRNQKFAVPADVPVAVTTTTINASVAVKMKVLGVRRVLIKPFKVRDVITTIHMLNDAA